MDLDPGESAPSASISDEELVARCREELPHQLDAYHTLVGRYEAQVFSTCMKMLANVQEAEEVSQDAFLRVFRKLKQFEGRSSFKTWLYRIVCNLCLTRRKSLAMRRERMEAVGEEITAGSQPVPDSAPGIAGAITHAGELSDRVREALDQMRPDDQQVIVLRFISDLSLEQMSEVLDIGLSATKMRLYRAMEHFKQVYSELAEISGIKPTRGDEQP